MDRLRRSGLLVLVAAIAFVVLFDKPGDHMFFPLILDAAQNGSSPAPRPAELPFSQLKPDAEIAITLAPGAAVADDGIWTAQHEPPQIVRIDAATNKPDAPLALKARPCASLAVAFGSVWVPTCQSATITRVDVKAGNVTAAMPLPVAEPAGSIAVAVESVWAAVDAKGVIARIDPRSNAAVAEAYVARRPFAVVAADDVVWVTSEEGDQLTRIDARTNAVVQTIKVGPRPGRLAIADGSVWTLNRGDGSVTRVDAKSSKVLASIAIDAAAATGDLAAGEGAVWVSVPGSPIIRIDVRSNRVSHRFVGPNGGAVVVGHGSLWVAAGAKRTWRLDPKLVEAMRP
jgi:YVTN family beta-propeller protein